MFAERGDPNGRRAGALFLLLAAVAAIPAWLARYPPIEDLPLHVATIRVIHDFHDPSFGFDRDFVLRLGRTQYLGYYLLGSGLASVLGVFGASAALASAYLAGTVLGTRSLLRALAADERVALLVVPLLYGPLFVLGLFPFLAGVPLLLFALAATARHSAAPALRSGFVCAGLALALFYWHVMPFLLAGIGAVILAPWRRPRAAALALIPLAPAAAAMILWLTTTDAGTQFLDVLRAHGARAPVAAAAREAYDWIGNSFRDRSDEVLFAADLAIAACSLVLAAARGAAGLRPRRYALLPIACVVLYFTGQQSHGFVWPLAQRFAFLAVIAALPLVRFPSGRAGRVATGAAAAVALASIANVAVHFRRFHAEEEDDFAGVLAHMQPGRRVAGLVFDAESRIVQHHPFLHFVSYYQAEKGGVVEFTYAGYDHWPIDFRVDRYPPPGGPARPRLEWTPRLVETRELWPYYDYVLVRGEGFRPPPGTFRVTWRSGRWSVWSREPGPSP